MNAEIDKFMQKPHRKFDSIFEEYIETRKKFDSLKQGQAAAADAAGGGGEGGAAKGQADALQNKINIMIKNQEIEMRHCKETAVKMANELLQVKLGEARFAYEEELEAISSQYEDLKKELQEEIQKKIVLKRKIVDLENIILQQQNMMETCGYFQNLWEDRKRRNIEEDNKLGLLDKMRKKDPKETHPKSEKMFQDAGLILDSMFNFYSFGVRINEEQCREIQDQTYPKMLMM